MAHLLEPHRAESLGDRNALIGFLSGTTVSVGGLRGGGFVLFTYLRTSQCRCIASINRSSSRIEVCVCWTRPGKSLASSAIALVISGRRSVPVWTFFTATFRFVTTPCNSLIA